MVILIILFPIVPDPPKMKHVVVPYLQISVGYLFFFLISTAEPRTGWIPRVLGATRSHPNPRPVGSRGRITGWSILSNMPPHQTKSTTSPASACSKISARSERYARRQVPITTTIIPESSETKIPDNTIKRPQPRAIRPPPETLVHQGERFECIKLGKGNLCVHRTRGGHGLPLLSSSAHGS